MLSHSRQNLCGLPVIADSIHDTSIDGPVVTNAPSSLGIHNLNPTHTKDSVVGILNKTPQQVKKRQLNQHRDLLSNIYNLGYGAYTVNFDEAAEAMLKRTYPEIANDTQDKAIFIPETFMPRVVMGVDPEQYQAQFAKLSKEDKKDYKLHDQTRELSGEILEKKMYTRIKNLYKDKEVVVLQGAELLIPGAKRGVKQESDIIVINRKLMYILNIEEKLTLYSHSMNSALKQLATTKELFNTYFQDISPSWVFIGAIGYQNIDESINICPDWENYVIHVDEVQRKIPKIEEIRQETLDMERGNSKDTFFDYRNMIKHLIFTIYANPGPIIKWNSTVKIFGSIRDGGQGDFRSVLFWTPSQFKILQLDDENNPMEKNVLLVSGLSTGKTSCMKGMIDKLLDRGQKCHFVLCNLSCRKKTILQVQLENYYKTKKDLIFSFFNFDKRAVCADEYYSRIKEITSQYPGHNTFIDELILSVETAELKKIVNEIKMHPSKPCLWISLGGIYDGNEQDYRLTKMKSTFPDFFIPNLRVPLRNCKQVISYVLVKVEEISAFGYDDISSKINLDIDVPNNMMEGLEPTVLFGRKNGKEMVTEAMQNVEQRQGSRGVPILINMTGTADSSTYYRIVQMVKNGVSDAGRKAIVYSSHGDIGESEERLKEWIKDRGSVDLITDLGVARGWEDSTVVVIDCIGDHVGVGNLCMRAVGLLIIVKTDNWTEDNVNPKSLMDKLNLARKNMMQFLKDTRGKGNLDDSERIQDFVAKSDLDDCGSEHDSKSGHFAATFLFIVLITSVMISCFYIYFNGGSILHDESLHYDTPDDVDIDRFGSSAVSLLPCHLMMIIFVLISFLL